MLVIIVEDDPQMADYLTKILRSHRYEVVRYGEALSALQHIRSRTAPDILLIDHQLPGGPNGASLASQARLMLPRCAILLMSLYAEKADIRNAMHIDADDYLEKPIDPEELIHSIGNAVIRRSMRNNVVQESRRVLGPLELDVAARQAYWYSKAIHLTPTEFSLLQHLTAAPGTVFNHAQLYSLLTGEHLPPSAARIKIKTHITNLKKKLILRDGGDPIKILKGQGIKWEINVASATGQ